MINLLTHAISFVSAITGEALGTLPAPTPGGSAYAVAPPDGIPDTTAEILPGVSVPVALANTPSEVKNIPAEGDIIVSPAVVSAMRVLGMRRASGAVYTIAGLPDQCVGLVRHPDLTEAQPVPPAQDSGYQSF